MKYIIIGDTAILASRDIEYFAVSSAVPVTVVGAPDGATLCLTKAGESSQKYFTIISEQTSISSLSLVAGFVYNVSFSWTTTEDGNEVQHFAAGNAILVLGDGSQNSIIPAPVASATDIENVWRGLVNILEVIVPFIDDYKNGSTVI